LTGSHALETLATETTAFGDLVVAKRPLGDEIECFYGDAATSNPTVKLVQRFGSMCTTIEPDTYLTSALVRGWDCHRETGETSGLALQRPLNPLPSVSFSHRLIDLSQVQRSLAR